MANKNYGAIVDDFIRKNTSQEHYRSVIGEMRTDLKEYGRHRARMRGEVSITLEDLFELADLFKLPAVDILAHIDEQRGSRSVKKMASLKIA